MPNKNESFAYVCSWNLKGGEPGIGLYKLNDDTGEINFVTKVNETLSCGSGYVDAKNNIIYFVIDTDRYHKLRDGGGGSVYAYKIDPETGLLTELNNVPTFCPKTSGISMDKEGKYLVVSNHSSMNSITKIEQDAFGKYHPHVEYSDATVELFSVNEDGSVGELLDVVKHTGSGPSFRQLQPHPHCVHMSPSGNLFAVCDKGNDNVYMYTIDRENNKLELKRPPFKNGSGTMPRTGLFHPTQPYFYLNSEAVVDVRVLKYEEDGNTELLSKNVSLEGEFNPRGYVQQDMALHPSGKYIYNIVRGPEVISVFEIGEDGSKIELIQNIDVEGKEARGCAISPNGKFLLVSCLVSGDLLVYAVGEDGKLTKTEHKSNQSAPSHISFFKA